MHGNYHSTCLSRSYRHIPIYKHSKLRRMEITTPRAFLGLIGICPFTNTPSYSAWKLPLEITIYKQSTCLSRSYRHMPIYKHSKLQQHGNYHSTCLSRSYRHMPIYKHSKLQCMEITTTCAFLGLIGICPFTNTPSYNAWKLPLCVPF
jgi:hypothetical protein